MFDFAKATAERTAKLVKEYPFSCGQSHGRKRCGACLVCLGLTATSYESYPDPDFSSMRLDAGRDEARFHKSL